MQFSSLPGPFVGCHSLFNGVQPAARNLLTDLQKAGIKAGIFLSFVLSSPIIQAY
jgi:hypothetical protein